MKFAALAIFANCVKPVHCPPLAVEAVMVDMIELWHDSLCDCESWYELDQ